MSENTNTTSVINEVVEAVITLINAIGLYATCTRGALPTGAGITCEIGPGNVSEVYMDKNTFVPLDVTLNAKHHNLKTVSDALNTIHSSLTRATSYPYDENGGRWEIVDISNYTLPQVVGREENNDWLMASALLVKFYWKGD